MLTFITAILVAVELSHLSIHSRLLFANDLYREKKKKNEKNTADQINQIATSALFGAIPYPT